MVLWFLIVNSYRLHLRTSIDKINDIAVADFTSAGDRKQMLNYKGGDCV
jgi:hypothetical protein